jgi:misacylated tRNA(Ala) deacylase
VDFNLENFDKAEMKNYIDKANQTIKEDLPLHIKELPRAEAIKIPDLARLAMGIPDREKIRVVEIEGIDLQACGGTHVKSTGEVREITMAKAENKGKANRRIYFSLED